jgi:hypothetical protein
MYVVSLSASLQAWFRIRVRVQNFLQLSARVHPYSLNPLLVFTANFYSLSRCSLRSLASVHESLGCIASANALHHFFLPNCYIRTFAMTSLKPYTTRRDGWLFLLLSFFNPSSFLFLLGVWCNGTHYTTQTTQRKPSSKASCVRSGHTQVRI